SSLEVAELQQAPQPRGIRFLQEGVRVPSLGTCIGLDAGAGRAQNMRDIRWRGLPPISQASAELSLNRLEFRHPDPLQGMGLAVFKNERLLASESVSCCV